MGVHKIYCGLQLPRQSAVPTQGVDPAVTVPVKGRAKVLADSVNQVYPLMVICFLCRTDLIPKYCLDALRLPRIKD
jgi:hypothetical protein